jgi:hypothetical protein
MPMPLEERQVPPGIGNLRQLDDAAISHANFLDNYELLIKNYELEQLDFWMLTCGFCIFFNLQPKPLQPLPFPATDSLKKRLSIYPAARLSGMAMAREGDFHCLNALIC